jgi:hypothetical protein
MPIDNCSYTFHELAAAILPRYLAALREQLQTCRPMSEFAVPGKGPAALARDCELTADCGGCCVLVKDGVPFYVGISRRLLSRLRQHVIGRGHEDATLAYEMAHHQYPDLGTRTQAMADPAFRLAFEAAKAELRGCAVAFVRIDNAVERHLFEVYCAMTLDTHEWNSFETH